MALLDRLVRHEFVVVTGKGGVGKSIVSLLLARLFAEAGRHVLVLEVDPRENLHELAGVAPSGGDLVPIAPRLHLQHLQPQHVITRVVREHLRIEMLVRRVTASPVFTHFIDSAPGLKPMAILGYAYRLLRGIERSPVGAIDTVVLDAPATGHGVSLLQAPLVVSEVVTEGPFARMAADLAGQVRDTARTALVVVTQAEDMPVREALELREESERRLGRSPDLLVINGLYPPVEGQASFIDRRLGEAWQMRRGVNDRELARLAQQWLGPRVMLPLLPLARGPALVEALLGRLRPALAHVEG